MMITLKTEINGFDIPDSDEAEKDNVSDNQFEMFFSDTDKDRKAKIPDSFQDSVELANLPYGFLIQKRQGELSFCALARKL